MPPDVDASAAVSLRPAVAGELDLLRAIDEDAARLYAEHGVPIQLGHDYPYAQAELARWQRSIELGRACFALDAAGNPVGFASFDLVDGQPYLDQLAVRRSAMRRGIGARLLQRAERWAQSAGGSALWLTTYAHLPFNAPYYERHGYEIMPEATCSPGILQHLEDQRRHLPAPDQRVAMRLRLASATREG